MIGRVVVLIVVAMLVAPMLAVGPASASKGQPGPSAPGTQLWVRRYNGSVGSHDSAAAVAVSPDGSRVFVTGSRGEPDSDFATVAYDAATGARVWVRRYNGPANRGDSAIALVVSPDGAKVFVTGISDSFPNQERAIWATVAYGTASGAQLWVRRYSGPARGYDTPSAIGVSPGGTKMFVTGVSEGATSRDRVIVAYGTATGARLWVRRDSGQANVDDVATALGVSPDGTRVFTTGFSNGPGGELYVTVAYQATTGAQLWVTRYKGPGFFNGAAALGVSSDGKKVFVTGTSSGSAGEDYATVAYDATTGAQRWVTRYNGPGGRDDEAFALSVSPDGSKVFVTGLSDGSAIAADPNYDYATVAHDATTGARLWVRRYNGPANDLDVATELGVSPDGSKLFVSGTSDGSATAHPNYDYATLAYDATSGTRLWTRRFNSPNNDFDDAAGLAVGPDGSRLFITGTSEYRPFAFNSLRDYTTVAYSVT